MSVKQRIIGVLKDYRFYFIIICSGLLAFGVARAFLNGLFDRGSIIVAVIVFLLVYLGILWLYFFLKKRNVPLEKIFLLFAIILGVLFLIFLPPGESPDEINHFKRAYSVTDGHFVSEVYDDAGHAGAKLPVGFEEALVLKPEPGAYGEVIAKLSEPVSTEKDYLAFNNTALYHFLSYLPQEVGILIGKIFGASLEVMAYLAEISNFVVWLVLIYFAIKFAPRFKVIILFLALLPITLQEATSLAPDALAIGLGIFMISFVCHLVYERKTKLKVWEIILLYVVAIMIGYCKIVYLPLVALYLLIPAERFGSKRLKWIHASILLVLLVVLNISWLSTSSQFLMEFNPGVNSGEQLAGILHNPLRYAGVLLNSLNVRGEFYATSLLGINLGAFTFNFPMIFFFVSFAIFVILFAQRDESLNVTGFQRAIFGITFLAITVLMFTSIYIQWSPVGLSFVDGVQGRYFLPILLLVPFAVARKPRRKAALNAERTIISTDTIVCYLFAMNIVAVSMFFAQNY
ncbi:MAG: DUF2142 domain-containing protein [Candidatus Saccharibacteria bacterium]|nr:DUF2142 domain-containing protein [Candidatus Saccharibacteria bacterium]